MHMVIQEMISSLLITKGLDMKRRLSKHVIVKQTRAYHICTTPAPS